MANCSNLIGLDISRSSPLIDDQTLTALASHNTNLEYLSVSGSTAVSLLCMWYSSIENIGRSRHEFGILTLTGVCLCIYWLANVLGTPILRMSDRPPPNSFAPNQSNLLQFVQWHQLLRRKI